MALALKVVGGTWENASRDKRELSVYKELGYEVAVVAKGNASDRGRSEIIDGFKVYRLTTRPLGAKAPDTFNRFLSIFYWAKFVRKLHPEVISGHDLIPGLTISWLASLFTSKKTWLIYDSHEFEMGRNQERSKIVKILIKWWEGFLLKKCAFAIMVNDTIADAVKEIHKLRNKPISVRSTPNNWKLNAKDSLVIRNELLRSFER